MDPATLALAGTAVSAVTGAVGAISSAGAQSAQANYQAQVARNNQQIAAQNAAYVAQQGAVRAQTEDMRNRQILGAIGAAQAASGVDIGTGTPVQVRRGAEQVGRFNTESIYQQDLLRSIGYTEQSQAYGAQAAADAAAARSARTAGYIGAGSSLLGGASSFAAKWARFQDIGAFDTGSSSLGDWSPR